MARTFAELATHLTGTRPSLKQDQSKSETAMKSTKKARSAPREAQNLAVRYGEIGISAVAAAIQYHREDKEAGEASTDRRPNRWLEEAVPEIAA